MENHKTTPLFSRGDLPSTGEISDDTIEKLREIFLSLDDDNSGTLSAGEAAGGGGVEEAVGCGRRWLLDVVGVFFFF